MERALDGIRASVMSFEVKFQRFGHHYRKALLSPVGGQFEYTRAMFGLHLNSGTQTHIISYMHAHASGGQSQLDCAALLPPAARRKMRHTAFE